MDRLIEQFLIMYDFSLDDILMENHLTIEDAVYALNEIGLLDIETIMDNANEAEETFD